MVQTTYKVCSSQEIASLFSPFRVWTECKEYSRSV